jgi:hypothetical protein
MAFSCGARSAFKLKEQYYLRNMLSRRQLQGFVMRAATNINTLLAARLVYSEGCSLFPSVHR